MKRQKFFLHIGMHKSASSFLQRKIFIYQNKYLNNYKLITSKGKTSTILRIIKNYSKKIISYKIAKRKIRKLTQDYPKVIISHESLLGYHFYNFDDLKTNFNAMEKLFNKPNYLILFREQYEFLYSLWLHRVRKGIKKSFGEFVSNKKIENYNVKKSKNFLTNYKVYDFNTIFDPYLQILKKRAYFLNVKKISNEKYFNEIISLFVKQKNIKFTEIKLDQKVNFSREYELVYFYLFKEMRIINNLILIIIIFIYKYIFFFMKYEKMNYKHEHFNKATFKYFDIVSFLLKKRFIGRKFLSEINFMKKKIKRYFMNSNRVFYKKIYGKKNK